MGILTNSVDPVYTVCYGKKVSSDKKKTYFFENYNLIAMGYPKFIVSNQKEKSISIQRVKGEFHVLNHLVLTVVDLSFEGQYLLFSGEKKV